MLKQCLITAAFVVAGILSYHLYLKHTGAFSCVRGVYTVNIAQSISTLRKQALTSQKPEEVLLKLQNAINKLARSCPDGYIIVPDACIIAGKRKRIDLLTGTIREEKKAVEVK